MGQIICWWSGGITSAVACKKAQDIYGDECRFVMLDTMNEDIDTYRFMGDCEKIYGKKIEVWRSQKYKSIEDVWYDYNSLNTANGAICSYMLKRKVREDWEKENSFSHQVFGFESNKKEIKRAKALQLNHPQTNPLFPLIDSKLDKKDCLNIVQNEWGIKVPRAYSLGYHNNNCLNTGCVQGGIGYWQKIQREEPAKFEKMAKIEHDLTNRKGKPVTMCKDQSKTAKDSGFELVFLKPHPDYPEHKCLSDMKGREPKPLIDCNGFCGTNEMLPLDDVHNEIAYSEEFIK